MNKLALLLFLIFVSFTFPVDAQRVMQNNQTTNSTSKKQQKSDVIIKDQNERKLNVGFRTGISIISIGNFYFEGKENIKSLTTKSMGGLFIGLNADYKLYRYLRLRLEANYMSKGGGYESINPNVVNISSKGATNAKNYYQYKLKYLELPIIARFRPMDELTFVFLDLGMAPAYLTSSAYESNYFYSTSSPLVNSGTNTQIVDNASNFDLNLLVGGGVNIYNSMDFSITIDMRYNYGLIKIFDRDDNHNKAFSFAVGLTY